MPQENLKRSKAELEEADNVLAKVRLITQPEFGHELRRVQQTVAELRGQVIHLEWVGRKAKNHATDLEDELGKVRKERDALAEEVKQLQKSESDELERLGTENISLSRRVSHSDIELKTLRSLVQALGLSEVTSSASLVPGPSDDSTKVHSTSASSFHTKISPMKDRLAQTEDLEEGTRQERNTLPMKDGLAQTEDLGEGTRQERNNDGDVQEEDPCDRESSVLRNVQAEPTRIYRVLYPTDALASNEAQKWFPQAFAYVDIDLGPGYLDFLVQWIDFERFHEWQRTGGRLDKTERPKEITAWITEGRYLPRCKGPAVGAQFVKTFPEDMRNWWSFLQSPTSLHQEESSNDGWTALNKHGINGWFSIVAGMKWWGQGLKSLTGDSLRNGTEEWLAMMKELTVVLDMLKKDLKKEGRKL